jgi:serine/threonine-protein kinase
MMAEIPQKLGKYEIRREVGRGAMGVVYEGWDPMIARRVALKAVRRETLDRADADQMLERFRREAQAAGRLNHPNVVAVYEYGEDLDGTAYIAMEFVEGEELKEAFDRMVDFPLNEVVRIMGELLGALGHAHAFGIVHRDVKPANIFMLKDGRVKFGDFGIARIESSNLTQLGSVLGSPAYMSPEQFMGQRVDGRSDLFSAGVILYQFLTGEKPFLGQLTTIMHKVLKEDPIPPSELNFQVPAVFDRVVRKAMAKRPDERYQTAQEFSDALLSAMAGLDVSPQAAKAPAEAVNIEATMLMPRPGTARQAEAQTQRAPNAPIRQVSERAGGQEGRRGLSGGIWAALVVVIAIAAGGGFYLYKTKTQAIASPFANSAAPASSDAAAQAQRMLMNKMMGLEQR